MIVVGITVLKARAPVMRSECLTSHCRPSLFMKGILTFIFASEL